MGALTNLVTSEWNWWLFFSLVVLVSLCAAAATYPPREEEELRSGHAGGTDGPRTLPPASAVFAGRRLELERVVTHPGRHDYRATLFLITGESGVGKTEFAVQAAHRLADRFPDGQLFMGFRSHASGAGPLEVRDVLLDLMGTLAPDVPTATLDTSQLVNRWRVATADRRVLLILDDVTEAKHIERVRPNSEQCLVIATTRAPSIAGVDPDLHLRLGELLEHEAAFVIAEIMRRNSREVTATTVSELAAVHRLPLTVRHAVAQLLTGASPDLARTPERGGGADALTLSFGRLSSRNRLVLQRSALHPGPHLTAVFAGALAGMPAEEAEEALTELHRVGILQEAGPDSYGFHDHVRDLALADGRHRTAEQESECGCGCRRALERLFQASLDMARNLAADINAPVVTSVDSRLLTRARSMTEGEALSCLSANFDDLLAVIRLAIARSWNQTWRLASALAYYMRVRRNIPQAIDLLSAARRIAVRAADSRGEAVCRLEISRMERTRADYEKARDEAECALLIFEAERDLLGQANCHSELGTLDQHTGKYAAAAGRASTADALYCQENDKRGRADAQGMLGMLERRNGNYPTALQYLSSALPLFQEIGNKRNEAWILIEIGTVHRLTHAYDTARLNFREARRIYEGAGDRNGQAWADRELGIVARTRGQHAESLALLSEALRVFTELGGTRNRADALVELGTLHRVTGALEESRGHLERALAVYREIGNKRGAAWTELELCTLERLSGDLDSADAHLESADSIYAEIPDESGRDRVRTERGLLAALRRATPHG
ncbi:tetratricopeptide repeat protein [Streptomyces hilarionis]|uniref:tetratricopeptide repeat protein n=1 Tax=Streptomyces hilarionis TaxID=2839954 RepID=UPI002119C118|nr:tetratricopeptide repeat protein [Streptomyces hilarionis]MCQ9135401.1 tetratricopeptide repeat protein [Streptomyces hilarionis]